MVTSMGTVNLKRWYVEKPHPALAHLYSRVDCRLKGSDQEKEASHSEFQREFIAKFHRERLAFWLDLLQEDDVHHTGVKERIRSILTDVDNESHFQGLVGELLLDWCAASFRPKSHRSPAKVTTSTEPGVDMIELLRDPSGTAYLVIWEAKSTSGYPSGFSTRLKEFFTERAREGTANVLEAWIAQGSPSPDYSAQELRTLLAHLYKTPPTRVFFGSFIACDGRHITDRPNDLFPADIPPTQRKVTIFEIHDYDNTIREWRDALCRVRDSL